MDKTLKEYRREHGISQADIVSEINGSGENITRQTIGNIENARHDPKYETVKLIAESINVDMNTMADLLENTNNQEAGT